MKSLDYNVIVPITVIPVSSALSAGEVESDNMPLAPGETTDLLISVKNYGNDTMHNVVLILKSSVNIQKEIEVL